MNASKLTNGSEAEVLDMTSQTSPKGCSEECGAGCGQKGQQESYWKKDQDETSPSKAIRSSTSEKLVCRYCGSDDLAPSFIKQRDRRCRKCFSKRYGSTARAGKTRTKK